jgi:hypothetical protein
VRSSAALALAYMGEAAKEFAPQVAKLLEDPDESVRSSAALALGNMGGAAKEFAPQVAKLLEDPVPGVRSSAAKTLHISGPLSNILVLRRILSATYSNPEEKNLRRVDTYVLFGQDSLNARCISWLGDRSKDELPDTAHHSKEDAREAINALRLAFPSSMEDFEESRKLSNEAGENISHLIRGQSWSVSDVLWLKEIRLELVRARQEDRARAVDDALQRMRIWQWGVRAAEVIGLHTTAWLLLVILYPHVPIVQGLFFRHPWFRKFLGFGYVNLALTVIPVLRRRLFQPFGASLVPSGALGTFHEQTYFDGCKLLPKDKRGASPEPIAQVLEPLRGQRIVEGASGLGKTTLLRHLATRSRRTVALLRATECKEGVMAAIQFRLQGQARDENYLRILVHAGAIDILIDGLNEAPPETRARIAQFFQESFRGNFVLTTQPLSWDAPLTAEVWELQPLSVGDIGPFMLKQWTAFESTAKVSEGDYQKTVQQLLAELDKAIKEGDEIALERVQVLCNPMECAMAAELLSINQPPNIGRMQAQFQQLMEEDFRRIHGRDFPREQFAERVFEWRQSGRAYLEVKDFESEVECLVMHKLMRERTDSIKQKDGTIRNERRWVFRHDKVMESLLIPAFTGDHRDRRFKLWADVRFTGIYDLLAEMLPLGEADELKAFLVERSAEANDNTLSNRFIRLLYIRELSPEGVMERQYLNAKASLLEVAKLMGSATLPDGASQAPPNIQAIIKSTEAALQESSEKARQLNFVRKAEIERTLEDLKAHVLTRQPVLTAQVKERIQTMPTEQPFDVFLSHNSKDKPAVRHLAEELKARGLRVWLDEWELVPGRPWQEALEKIIQTTRSAAVLVGADGFGPWETPEMHACLSQFVERQLPVIPVLLPDAPAKPALPLFLMQFTWVDLRGGSPVGGMDRLIWGITGVKPTPG